MEKIPSYNNSLRWRGYLLVVAISRVFHIDRIKNKSEFSTVARTVPPGSHGWRHVSDLFLTLSVCLKYRRPVLSFCYCWL